MADIRVTPLLDDFERPDENPAQPPWYFQPNANLEVVIDDGILRSPSPPNDSALDYWAGDPEGIKAPAEVWGIGAGSAALGSAYRIGLYTLYTVATSAPNGYQLLLGQGVSGDFLVLRRYDAGSFIGLFNVDAPIFGSGTILVYRLDATQDPAIHEVWFSHDGGANFNLEVSYSEASPHFGPYQFILGGTDNLVGWDAFGGGTIRRTQIYRYVSN